eukprot:2909980-Rhodomonas_salina.1
MVLVSMHRTSARNARENVESGERMANLERKSGVESARARVLKVLGGLGEQNEGVLFERYVGQPAR